jgi:hypothetical protein
MIREYSISTSNAVITKSLGADRVKITWIHEEKIRNIAGSATIIFLMVNTGRRSNEMKNDETSGSKNHSTGTHRYLLS